MRTLLLLAGIVGALSLKAKHHLSTCSDEEYNAFMTPKLVAAQRFFEKEHYNVYPFALSAFGALRYGGNSIEANGKRQVMDQDVDLMISPKFGVENVTQNAISMEPLMTKLKANLQQHGVELSPMRVHELEFLAKKDSKHMLEKLTGTKDGLIAGHKYSMKSLRLKAPKNELQSLLEKHQILASIPTHTKAPTAWLQQWMGKLRKEYPTQPMVQFDIFYSLNKDQKDLQAHPTKKMMFYSVPMAYPVDSHIITSSLYAVEPGMAANYFDSNPEEFDDPLCEFKMNKVLHDNREAIAAEHDRAKTCSNTLKKMGFESMHHCFNY